MTWATRVSVPLVAAAVTVVFAGCASRPSRPFNSSDRASIGPEASPRGSELDASSPRPLPVDATQTPEGPPAEPSEGSANRPSRTWGWVLFSVGAEGAILAGITSFMMLHDKSVRDDNCDANKVCSQAGLAANGDIASLAWWNVGAWAVAGAGLGVGGLLLLTSHPAGAEHVAIGISPSGSGIGLGARGAF